MATGAALAVAALGLAARGEAQARQSVSMAGAQALSAPPPPALQQQDDTAEERDPNPMGIVGVGLKLGVAGTGPGALTVSAESRSLQRGIEARRGLHVAIPLQFGAGSFGWTLEPYLSRSRVSHALRNDIGVVTGSEDVDLTAYGVYTGPVVNIHVITPLYLGVGVGVKGAYIANDGFDYAFDAYARAPISATYYVTNHFALVAEVGLGYGLSIFADHPRVRLDPVTNKLKNVPEEPQVGKAFAWDCSLGVRLP